MSIFNCLFKLLFLDIIAKLNKNILSLVEHLDKNKNKKNEASIGRLKYKFNPNLKINP